jgi:hypothetical protein
MFASEFAFIVDSNIMNAGFINSKEIYTQVTNVTIVLLLDGVVDISQYRSCNPKMLE